MAKSSWKSNSAALAALALCLAPATGRSQDAPSGQAPSQAQTQASAAKGASHTVTIDGMSYGAISGDLHVGDTVVWVNNDSVPHTATARDHSFDVRVGPGKSASMVLRKAGSFPFYCLYHPLMRGVLTVGN